MSIKRLRGQSLLRAGGASYQSNVLAIANLISYWPLNETSGTTAVDAKSGFSGTYQGGFTLANLAGPGASMGSAPLLNGTTGLVQLPAASLNTPFSTAAGTLAIWVNPNELWSVNDVRMMAVVGVDDNNRVELVKNGVSTATFYSVRGGAANERDAAQSSANWHHFAVSWDINVPSMKGYIDGTQQGATLSLSGVWSGALNNTRCQIGAYSSSTFWKGWLSACALYSRALSQSEITTLATAI